MIRFSADTATGVMEEAHWRGDGAEPAVEPFAESPSDPAPFDNLDPIVELEDQIRTLASQIHAATHRLLVLIAEFDRRRGWEMGGHRCCADWLSFTTGIDRGAARERVRAARALVGLPEISEAMSRGELSFSQVRALTRVATPQNESELLPLAMDTPASRLERVMRGWRRGSRQDEARREEELHQSRCLSVFPDEDGMYVVRGLLPPDLGLLLARAIEAGADALYREEGRTLEALDPEGHRAAAARRRADALGLVAERALGAGFGSGADGQGSARLSGSRADRYQVVLHVDAGAEAEADAVGPAGPAGNAGAATKAGSAGNAGAATKAGSAGNAGAAGKVGKAAAGSPAPRSHFHDGTRVSGETSRRLCCDASVVRVEVAGGGGGGGGGPSGRTRGDVLSVGRKTRVISPALRRALEIRDQGCRFPGCACGFTDAHHIVHWWNGGETSLANTLLLCRHHHRLVHEGGWGIRLLNDGIPVFVDPRGGERFDGGWVAGRKSVSMALFGGRRPDCHP
jgi:hypothetical protein